MNIADRLDPNTMTIINTSMANGYFVDKDTGKREVFTFPIFIVYEDFDYDTPETLSIWTSEYLADQEVKRLRAEHEQEALANGYKCGWRHFYLNQYEVNKSEGANA